MASLFVVSEESVEYYPLGRMTMVLGRDEAASIQIVDKRISRKHLQIRFNAQGHKYIALDMRSKNGTFVNGERLKGEAVLSDGDRIGIGDAEVLFTRKDFPERESALHHFKQAGQRRFTTHVDPPF